jgi:LAO/AO transport system kinase
MLNGDRRSLSKLVSAIEHGELDLDLLVNNIQDKTCASYIIGITGPPGSGKSTVVGNLINKLSKENLKVAFLAVDPTSPFDGGALLGDRIRVADLNLNENVFIRSMGTRGSVGGLNTVVGITVELFTAFGFDIVIVESVGVGQVDIDIMNISDTVIVTTVPEAGDEIQILKRGLIEIADIFVVNKIDRPGSNHIATALEEEITSRVTNTGWTPPVILSQANKNIGIDLLKETIEKHKDFLNDSGVIFARRGLNRERQFVSLVENNSINLIRQLLSSDEQMIELRNKIKQGELNPYVAALKVNQTLDFNNKNDLMSK